MSDTPTVYVRDCLEEHRRHSWRCYAQATVAEVAGWLREQGAGVEMSVRKGGQATKATMLRPGRYLVYRLDDE